MKSLYLFSVGAWDFLCLFFSQCKFKFCYLQNLNVLSGMLQRSPVWLPYSWFYRRKSLFEHLCNVDCTDIVQVTYLNQALIPHQYYCFAGHRICWFGFWNISDFGLILQVWPSSSNMSVACLMKLSFTCQEQWTMGITDCLAVGDELVLWIASYCILHVRDQSPQLLFTGSVHPSYSCCFCYWSWWAFLTFLVVIRG